MNTPPRRPRWYLVPALLLTACTTWSSSRNPTSLDPAVTGQRLRVVQRDGRVSELTQAALRGDTIIGRLANVGAEVAIPRADVLRVQVRTVSGTKTVFLVAALGATAILVANAARSDPPPPPPPSGGGGFGCCASCPLVYSWDGRRWRLDSGTFGGAITAALQRTDVDNLDHASVVNGRLRLRVTNELQETDHVDALSVLAVDHDTDVTVAPDAAGRLHSISAPQAPVAAVDLAGRDALARVRTADGWGWESALEPRDPGRDTDLRDGLALSFVRPRGAVSARLVVDANNTAWAAWLLLRFVGAHGRTTAAWYDSLNASPESARALGTQLAREAFLRVEVRTDTGWAVRGLIWEAGPEILKRQAHVLDLDGVVGDTVQVRLTSVPAFWFVDRVAVDFAPERPVAVRELALVSARTSTGRDVAPLIAREDRRYYTLQTGDAAEITFRAPPPIPGRTRSYVLRSSGWYRVRADESHEPDTRILAMVHAGPQGLARAAVAELERVRALATVSR